MPSAARRGAVRTLGSGRTSATCGACWRGMWSWFDNIDRFPVCFDLRDSPVCPTASSSSDSSREKKKTQSTHLCLPLPKSGSSSTHNFPVVASDGGAGEVRGSTFCAFGPFWTDFKSELLTFESCSRKLVFFVGSGPLGAISKAIT